MKALMSLIVFLAVTASSNFAHAQSDPGLVGIGDWVGDLEIRFAQPPIDNRLITIQVPSDGCLQSGPRIDPELTTIVREGMQVSIDFHASILVCFSAGDPPGVWVYDQNLGSFAAGDYTLTARYHYIETPAAPPFAVLSTSMPVARGAAGAVALPAISAGHVALLVILLALIGIVRSRQRRLPS